MGGGKSDKWTTNIKGRYDTFSDFERSRNIVNGIEQWFLVFLEIFVVGGGQTLIGHEETRHLFHVRLRSFAGADYTYIAKNTAGLSTQEFERIWVLLLGHNTGASAVEDVKRSGADLS